MGDKITREQTGHRSNELFNYQKASENQSDNASEVLVPRIDSQKNSCTNTIVANKSVASKAAVENDRVQKTMMNRTIALTFVVHYLMD